MSLVLDHVTKEDGAETHIRDVTLALAKGTLNVLLGATLSGKTSLMRLMAGLDAPTRGRVLVDGQDVTGWPVQARSAVADRSARGNFLHSSLRPVAASSQQSPVPEHSRQAD